MPSLEQRLEYAERRLLELERAIAGVERDREAILRGPKPIAETRARLRALEDHLGWLKEVTRATTAERDDLLAEISRREP